MVDEVTLPFVLSTAFIIRTVQVQQSISTDLATFNDDCKEIHILFPRNPKPWFRNSFEKNSTNPFRTERTSWTMEKRSTGSDGVNLRQVVVEQPKMVKKEEGNEDNLGKEEEEEPNKSSIADGRDDEGVRRRGGANSTMDEIEQILQNDGGTSIHEEEVEATKIEFGRKGTWNWCCRDLNRWTESEVVKFSFVQAMASYVEACEVGG